MARKFYNYKTFEFEHDGFSIEIKCATQDTSYGFRHVATLWTDTGRTNAKACYYNRTWEAYEYQSVLFAAIRKANLTPDHKSGFKTLIDKYNSRDSGLNTIAAVASLGDIFSKDQTEANDWKKRMLAAGLGEALQMPDDWDQLTEDEKTKRLNGAISALEA